jgi:ribosomal protein S27E
MSHMDGNMLGGDLGELFTMDMTMAVVQCASCGTPAMMAQTMVYADAPGVIARCASCGEIMLRLVRGPDRAWLDLRGVTYLQLAVPAEQ